MQIKKATCIRLQSNYSKYDQSGYDGFPPNATFVFQKRSKSKKCINENAKVSE